MTITPPPTPPNIGDIISRLRTGYGRRAGDSSEGGIGWARTPFQEAAPLTQEEKGDVPAVVQGGINLAGGLIRAVTSLGRASTNIANEVLPYGVKAADALAKDDYWGYLGNTAMSVPAALQGLAKGVLYSFAVPGEESRTALQKVLGGEKPVEGGYELMQTENWKAAERQTPGLKEFSSEEVVGEIPLPFGLDPFKITKAGLYSFGWDVGTDPFSWATMGLGGAVKGAGRGVAAATKAKSVKAAAATQGRKATRADLPEKNVPRPFYRYSADKAEQLTPANVSYDITNTSVPMYILKEMGRGFKESHQRALALSISKREARAAKRAIGMGITRLVSEALEKGEKITGETLLDFSTRSSSEAFAESLKKFQDAGIANPSNAEALAARVQGRIDAALPEIIKDLPVYREVLVDNAAEVAKRADEAGISRIEAANYSMADAFARRIDGAIQIPAIKQTRASKFQGEEMLTFSRNLKQSVDPKTGAGKFGDAWENVRKTANASTLRGILESIVEPIGYRTAKLKDALSEKKILEPIAGTRKARVTTKVVASPELRELKKRLRMRIEDIEGGKSESVAKMGRKTSTTSDADIMNAPQATLAALAKEFNAEPNEAFREYIYNNPELITGEMLERAMAQPAMMAERIAYTMERDAASETSRFSLVKHLEKQGYNPITATTGSPKISSFATTQAQRVEAKGDRVATTTLREAVRLAVEAKGGYYSPELTSVMKKLGINRDALFNGSLATNIEETVHAAFIRRFEKKYEGAVRQLLTKQFGDELKAAELIDNNEVEQIFASIREVALSAETKAPFAFGVTDEELTNAIDIAIQVRDRQVAALDKLNEIGVSYGTLAGRLIIDVLGNQSMFRGVSRTGTGISKQLDQLTLVKGALKAPNVGDGPNELRPLFAKVFDDIKASFRGQAPDDQIREMVAELRTLANDTLAKTPVGSQRVVRALFAQMGNIVARYEGRMSRSTVQGFDFAFTRRGGEYDPTWIASFIARAHSASRTKDSIDGGQFADRFTALDGIKSHAEKTKVAAQFVQSFSGEGISPALLSDVMRNAENVGTRGSENLAGNPAFKQDVQRAVGNLYKNAEDELVASGRLAPASGSEGWINKLSEPEQKLARGAISSYEATLSDDLATAFTAQLAKRNVTNIVGKGNTVKFSNIAKLQKAFEEKGLPFDGAIRRVRDQLVRESNQSAVDTVARVRANELVKQFYPAMATEAELLKMANKVGRRENAYDALHSRLILANMMLKADIESSFADSTESVVSKLRGEKTPEGLRKERTQMETLTKELEAKYRKEGYKATTADVESMSIDEVIGLNNPLAFLTKVRTMEVQTSKQREEWQAAMRHMLDMTVTGKGKAYASYRQLLESYRTPVDGQRQATDAEVLETLRILGGAVGARAENIIKKKDGKVQRRTILNLLRDAEETVQVEEIKRAKDNDYIREINIAGGDEIRQMSEVLPEAKEIAKNAHEVVSQMRMDMEARNLGWLEVEVSRMLGASMKQFIVDRGEFLVNTYRDSLGRIIDTAGEVVNGKKIFDSVPKGQPGDLKRTWESYTNYTGFKKLMQTLDDMAEELKVRRSEFNRGKFFDDHAMLALRLRDAYLLSRGIVPQHSIRLTGKENEISNLTDLRKEGRDGPAGVVSVYLSEVDVMDIFPAQTRQQLFWAGREASVPPTSLLPGARLLVAAIADLPEGKWFTAEQVAPLARAMVEVTVDEVRKSSTSGFKHTPLFAIDEEAVASQIDTIVRTMLKEENAQKLFDQHMVNSAIALKVLKYKADEISSPIMEALARAFTSKVASSSDKMQATTEAMEEMRRILGQEDLGPEEVRLMATMDMQVMLATEVDYDGFLSLQEAQRFARAGKPAPEAKAARKEVADILKVQKASQPKDRVNAIADAMAATADARTKMLDQIFAAKVVTANKAGKVLTADESFDVFNDVYTNKAFYGWALKFGDSMMERLFFDYKMEDLRRLYGGMERKTVEDTEEYTGIMSGLAKRWAGIEVSTGVNYPALAFKALQGLTDEQLPKIAMDSEVILDAIRAKRADSEVRVDPVAASALMDAGDALKAALPDAENDPLLLEAIVDLWTAGGHFFSGGANSKIARTAVPPRWLNRMIRFMGHKEAIESIDPKTGDFLRQRDGFGFNLNAESGEEMAKIWREWDIENPVQMFAALNSALARASKVPMAAAEIQSTYGVKLADFAKPGENSAQTMARARAEGLVKVKDIDKLDEGKELVHFMNTRDYLYPKAIAEQLGVFSRFLTEPYREFEAVRRVANKYFDGIQNFAKQQMTLFRLGNWVMNFNGGLWTNFKFGVNSPASYLRAAKAMQVWGVDVANIGVTKQSLEGQVAIYHANRGKEGLVVKAANDPLASDTVLVTAKGKATPIKLADMAELYRTIGGRIPTAQSRELDQLGEAGSMEAFSKALSARKIAELYNKTAFKLGRWAAVRDDFLRFSLWMDIMSKRNWNSLEEGAKEALRIVDRAHPQMQDLSKFNSQVTRHLVLFFTWRAKTLGWVLHDLLDKPARLIIPLKAQYALEVSQGDEPEYFGSFDTAGDPIRSFQQGSMDFTTPGNEFAFSLANPVTDLLGSTGWLSGISANTYESPETQLIASGFRTWDNFANSSQPLMISFVVDWMQGRTSSGADLTRNGITVEKDLPLAIENAMGQLGLGWAHLALAYAYPEAFQRATWRDAPMSDKDRDALRTIVSWTAGIRPRELETNENRQKAIAELMSKLQELNQQKPE